MSGKFRKYGNPTLAGLDQSSLFSCCATLFASRFFLFIKSVLEAMDSSSRRLRSQVPEAGEGRHAV